MKREKYIDSEIVRLRQLHRSFRNSFDLETDRFQIQGKTIQFEYRDLFSKQVRMLLPGSFEIMADEIVRLRYLSNNRPQLILTGESFAENIGLTMIARNNRDLADTIRVMREAVMRHSSESVLYDSGKISAQDLTGHWFEYKSFSINEEVYNLQFLLGSEQTLLLGIFNCRMRYYNEWKPFIQKALEYTKLSEGGTYERLAD